MKTKKTKLISEGSVDKKRSFIVTLFAFLFCLYTTPITAQDLPVATISASGKIVLDVNLPVSSSYQADISHLQFSDEEAAKAFFKTLEDGVTTISLDFMSKKATIHLATKMLADANMHWDVNQWNEYFSQKEAGLVHIKGQ